MLAYLLCVECRQERIVREFCPTWTIISDDTRQEHDIIGWFQKILGLECRFERSIKSLISCKQKINDNNGMVDKQSAMVWFFGQSSLLFYTGSIQMSLLANVCTVQNKRQTNTHSNYTQLMQFLHFCVKSFHKFNHRWIKLIEWLRRVTLIPILILSFFVPGQFPHCPGLVTGPGIYLSDIFPPK